jgi:hypothetical protein
MTKLITVHGTNAGSPSDEGEQWWQRNSSFQKRLAEWLNLAGVEIEPFHWGEGPNSEIRRLKAAVRLLQRLKTLERGGEHYHLIGHSHGGSVIYNALLLASGRKETLPHLRSWLTVGTPFLWTKISRVLFFRHLSQFQKLAFLLGIVVFVWLFKICFSLSFDELFRGLFVFLLPALLALAIAIFARNRSILLGIMNSGRAKASFKSTFLRRWHCLRSRNDEAINALSGIERLRLRLFHGDLLWGPARGLFVWVAGLALLVVLSAEIESKRYTGVTLWLSPWVLICGLILAFLLVGPLTYLVGIPVSKILNNITSAQMRRIAFGNDLGLRVARVAPVLEGCNVNYGLISGEMEAALTAFSDKHAVKTLANTRQVLGLNKQTQSERDVAKIMAEQISWHELIHTAYFDVDEFAKLIAYVLHKAGLAPLSESFKVDPDYEKIKFAFECLTPLATETSTKKI